MKKKLQKEVGKAARSSKAAKNCEGKSLSKNKQKRLRLVSLFSGCGGMDLGFEGGFSVISKCINKVLHPEWICEEDGDWVYLPRTRFDTVFANDIREDARRAWVNYFGKRGTCHDTYKVRSIVDLVKEAKTGAEGIFPRNVDVVTGGFPCQDFSVAGKRLGFNSITSHDGKKSKEGFPSVESRGQLYMWMRDVISITLPKVFIAENVKGLVSLADAKHIIEDDFRSIGNGGYLVVDARVLCAADYGVPQSRERVIFIGFKRESLTEEAITALSQTKIPAEYDPYPIVTHSINPCNGLSPYVKLRAVFKDLEEPENSLDPSHQKFSKARFMGTHCQGQKEISLDKIGPTIRSEHHGNIEFRRLSIANGGQLKEELDRGLQERRLSVRECARIQTFPNDYEFVFDNEIGRVNSSQAYQIIGNAVPPLLAFNIAMRLQENWTRYFGQE
jgi:DNA (cytosine-5)-methyltransferase 1